MGVIALTALVCLGVTCLCAPLVVLGRRRRMNRLRAFGAQFADAGLRPSRAPRVGRYHWVGTWRGREAVLGYYSGAVHRENTFSAGVGLLMHSGAFQENEVSAVLERPPKLSPGDRRLLEGLLTPARLEAASEIPEAGVFPARGLLVGAMWDEVIRDGFAAPWDGLILRASLPIDASRAQVTETLDAMSRWLDALQA